MTTMKPYVKEWYDALTQGKIMGLRCKTCGAMEFPPYPVCNTCSSTDVEWEEISGDAELITFATSLMGAMPYTDEEVVCGWFKLKEGPIFVSRIINPPEDPETLLEQLPIPAKAEVLKLSEEKNIFYPVFRLVK